MRDAFICPACHAALEQLRMEHGIFWACRQCGGRALSIELLRRTFAKESINPLWLRIIRGDGRPGRDCPCCERAMTEVALADHPDSPAVDVCRPCHFAWFDASEIGELQPIEVAADSPRALRTRELREVRKHDLDDPPLHEWWQQLIRLLMQWVG